MDTRFTKRFQILDVSVGYPGFHRFVKRISSVCHGTLRVFQNNFTEKHAATLSYHILVSQYNNLETERNIQKRTVTSRLNSNNLFFDIVRGYFIVSNKLLQFFLPINGRIHQFLLFRGSSPKMVVFLVQCSLISCGNAKIHIGNFQPPTRS